MYKIACETRICASLGLRMKFKTLFMSDDIVRLDGSPLQYSDCENADDVCYVGAVGDRRAQPSF